MVVVKLSQIAERRPPVRPHFRRGHDGLTESRRASPLPAGPLARHPARPTATSPSSSAPQACPARPPTRPPTRAIPPDGLTAQRPANPSAGPPVRYNARSSPPVRPELVRPPARSPVPSLVRLPIRPSIRPFVIDCRRTDGHSAKLHLDVRPGDDQVLDRCARAIWRITVKLCRPTHRSEQLSIPFSTSRTQNRKSYKNTCKLYKPYNRKLYNRKPNKPEVVQPEAL